jgi:hypothetical protein
VTRGTIQIDAVPCCRGASAIRGKNDACLGVFNCTEISQNKLRVQSESHLFHLPGSLPNTLEGSLKNRPVILN